MISGIHELDSIKKMLTSLFGNTLVHNYKNLFGADNTH